MKWINLADDRPVLERVTDIQRIVMREITTGYVMTSDEVQWILQTPHVFIHYQWLDETEDRHHNKFYQEISDGIDRELKRQKLAGKEFITPEMVDDIIREVLAQKDETE